MARAATREGAAELAGAEWVTRGYAVALIARSPSVFAPKRVTSPEFVVERSNREVESACGVANLAPVAGDLGVELMPVRVLVACCTRTGSAHVSTRLVWGWPGVARGAGHGFVGSNQGEPPVTVDSPERGYERLGVVTIGAGAAAFELPPVLIGVAVRAASGRASKPNGRGSRRGRVRGRGVQG